MSDTNDTFEACEECSGTGLDLADGSECFNCDGHAMFQIGDSSDDSDESDDEDEEEDDDDYEDEDDGDDE